MHLRFGVNKGCYANHKRRKIAAFLNISFNFMMVQLSFVWIFPLDELSRLSNIEFTRLIDRIRRIHIKRGKVSGIKYEKAMEYMPFFVYDTCFKLFNTY